MLTVVSDLNVIDEKLKYYLLSKDKPPSEPEDVSVDTFATMLTGKFTGNDTQD